MTQLSGILQLTIVCGTVVAVTACTTSAPAPYSTSTQDAATARPKNRAQNPPERRTASGLNFVQETRVDATPQASASGFDDERAWGGEDDWEPFAAVDPSRGYVYQFTTRFVDGAYRILFRRSTDGGSSWEDDRLLFPSGIGQADPYAKVAEDGTVYAIWLENWDTVLARSFDFGETWTEPVATNGSLNWSDYPSLAISPNGKDVYVAFNRSDSFVASSHDFGESFASPVKTSDDQRYWYHAGGAVGPDGTVYFGATSMKWNAQDDVELYVLRSADGGGSWQTLPLELSREAPDCDWSPGCEKGFLLPTIGLDIDSTGTVMTAYNAGARADEPQQIWVRSSRDQGRTWSARKRISGFGAQAHNAFPAVAAGPVAGDFRVVWQGTAGADTATWNTWISQTLDGGTTWSRPIRLSNQSTGAPYKGPRGYRFPYGDYLAIAVDDLGTNHVIWGEGASWNGPGGTWYTRGAVEVEGKLQ